MTTGSEFLVPLPSSDRTERLAQIERARLAAMREGKSTPMLGLGGWVDRSWIEESWRRCLASGLWPNAPVAFDMVSAQTLRRTEEAHHDLLCAAKPILNKLGSAIASTRYFAILTDAKGTVIEVDGDIDRSDPRAAVIARVGVDLSEQSVGTSAIGSALHEQKPVWLHRGEHFFADTSVYSCAGAPVFSPQGQCLGMLDLTGVDVQERPELTHLVAQSARSIENAMVERLPYALMVRVNWPGYGLGEASDGLLALDAHGHVLGYNLAAKQMLSVTGQPKHASDVFAFGYERLFDAAKAGKPCLDVPLWSGLRINAEPLQPQQTVQHINTSGGVQADKPRMPLKDMATHLIKQAVLESKGNVVEAARKLGVSRATIYRKLAPNKKSEI